MFRAGATFALCALSGCGLGLGGELLVPSAEPNTQQSSDAGVVEIGDLTVAAASSAGDVGTQDGISAPVNTNDSPSDSGPSRAWMSPDAGIDSTNDAAADADSASVTNGSMSDAPFFLDGTRESSAAITDAAAETSASSCEQLVQCCDQLTMTGAPAPVLATCFAQQWDGGDPSACDMVLAGLSGAGFCP